MQVSGTGRIDKGVCKCAPGPEMDTCGEGLVIDFVRKDAEGLRLVDSLVEAGEQLE